MPAKIIRVICPKCRFEFDWSNVDPDPANCPNCVATPAERSIAIHSLQWHIDSMNKKIYDMMNQQFEIAKRMNDTSTTVLRKLGN